MQTLKSMKNFEKEVLEAEKMATISGGDGRAVDDGASTKYHSWNTMDEWNCADLDTRVDMDIDGKWFIGTRSTVFQETP